jgi:hypothetical protein
LIDRAGRLVLIKAVLTARPIHHLLVENAPLWLLEEINKWLRAFFWAGKAEANGGQCLVAWEVVCKPTSLGGLGVKNLKLQGLALRARWHWLRRTDPDKPWQGLPPIKDVAAMEVFESLAKIEVGDGRTVLFWKDRWINGFTAEEIAPLVTALVPTRRRNSRKVYDALRGNAWVRDLLGNISIEGCIQCICLWEKIEEVERHELQPDKYTWKGAPSGKYSAKDTYRMLCQGGITDGNHEQVWKARVPLKCKIFTWLALRDRLWTSERRFRHGLQDQRSPCFTYLQEEDTVDHILVQCPYSRMVWFRCFQETGLQIEQPQMDSLFGAWWSRVRLNVSERNRRKFDALVILIGRTLWKQRNARVFGNIPQQWGTERIVESIIEEFKLWEIAFAGGSNTLTRD